MKLYCKNCNALLKPEAKFCSNCGEQVINEAIYIGEHSEKSIYCPNCGAAINKAVANYCPACGFSLKDVVRNLGTASHEEDLISSEMELIAENAPIYNDSSENGNGIQTGETYAEQIFLEDEQTGDSPDNRSLQDAIGKITPVIYAITLILAIVAAGYIILTEGILISDHVDLLLKENRLIYPMLSMFINAFFAYAIIKFIGAWVSNIIVIFYAKQLNSEIVIGTEIQQIAADRSSRPKIPIVAIILFLAVIFARSSNPDLFAIESEQTIGQNYIDMVRGCSLYTEYPDVETGDAFDAFFTSQEWEYFIPTDDQQIVQVTGDYTLDGEPSEMLIQFLITPIEDEENMYYISFYAMEIKGVAISSTLANIQLSAIFSEYNDSLQENNASASASNEAADDEGDSLSSGETAEEQEIRFKDIPWGTSFEEVDSLLSNLELKKYTAGYAVFCVDYLEFGTYNSVLEQNYESDDIKINASATYREYFAGYPIGEEALFFAYTPVDGELTKTEEDSALYGVRLGFSGTSCAIDLINELTSEYGAPDDAYSYRDDEYRIWYGTNDTELVLRIEDDAVYICYVWTKGDEMLKTASDTYD